MWCHAGGDSDSEEEMSEGEELRQAAAAAAAHSRRAAAKQEEVIVLSDSDEDAAAPPARHPLPQHRPSLQHTPTSSPAGRLHPSVRAADVWPSSPRASPASLQPSGSHAAPARAPPLPQVCIMVTAGESFMGETSGLTVHARQVLTMFSTAMEFLW